MSTEQAQPVLKSPLLPSGPLKSVTALARFEFEHGRSNEGTKVMMVEWQDDDKTRQVKGSWEVSWTGKKTTFAADDNPSDNIRRLYFLLPPGVTIPPQITITYYPPQSENSTESEPALQMDVNPLPAIFTPELGATSKTSGKKGVLHTIWAKKRLQVLDKEIEKEEELNLEGIALEMASAEKKWIEQNFGVVQQQPSKPLRLDLNSVNKSIAGPLSPGIQSPRSPGGRRLTEKLRGLSLVTNEQLGSANTTTGDSNPLSPEAGDVAVSSFSTFKGQTTGSSATTTSKTTSSTKRIVAQAPPEHIKDQQSFSTGGFSSLASIQKKKQPKSANSTKSTDADEEEDDLFAVAMSPRSPDDPKSPFSMSSAEAAGAFAKIKGVNPSASATTPS